MKIKLLTMTSLALAWVVLSWGIDLSHAQQTPVPQTAKKMTNYEKMQEESAAKRAKQGQMRSTTPAQRKAAAARLKAKLNAQKQQGAPASEGR